MLKSQVQLQNWGCIGEVKTKNFGFSITMHSHLFSKIKKFMLHSHWLKYFNIFLSFLFSLFSAPLCLSIFLYYLILSPLFFLNFFLFLLKFFLSFFSNFSTLCEGLFFCRVGVGVVGHAMGVGVVSHWHGLYRGCGWSSSWVRWVGHAVGFVWFLADLGLLGVRVHFFLHLILFKYHLFIFKHH